MKIKKLLSLFSAAAISASCFAGMAITASAEESQMYGEWLLNNRYHKASESDPADPGLFAGTATTLPDSSAHTLINYSNGKNKVQPALYYSRDTDTTGKNVCDSNPYKGTTTSFTTYSDQTIPVEANQTYGLKTSAGYKYTYVLDPKLEENNASSYTLKMVFWSNEKSSGSTKGPECTVKIVALNDLKFGQVADGEAIKAVTSANNTDLQEFTIPDLKSAVSFGFQTENNADSSAQPNLAYVGIEYTPAPAFEDVKATVEMAADKYGAPAAAAYATVKISDLNNEALKWSITANNGTEDRTQTIDATYVNGTLSGGGDAVLGLLISEIPDNVTITGAKIILE